MTKLSAETAHEAREALLCWLETYGVRIRMRSTCAVEAYVADLVGKRDATYFVGVRPSGKYTLTQCTNRGHVDQVFATRERLLVELVSRAEAAIVSAAISKGAKRAEWGRRVLARLQAAESARCCPR